MLYAGLVCLVFLVLQPLEVLYFIDYVALLDPRGFIGLEERDLLLFIQAIMLLVIIPVYLFSFIFTWRYSALRNKGKYDPDLVDNKVAEWFWWGIPTVFTNIIAVWTYVKTDELDPYKPLKSDKKEITIQVVALNWKWLFIYPEHGVATVNFFQFPVDTPVRFEITADAPMNSFWIPRLGGQIYAMPGMRTLLHLNALEPGEFPGCSANLSGAGFSGMRFIAKATSDEEFQSWIERAKSGENLVYDELVKPSQNNKVAIYKAEDGLFHKILMKYMAM